MTKLPIGYYSMLAGLLTVIASSIIIANGIKVYEFLIVAWLGFAVFAIGVIIMGIKKRQLKKGWWWS